MRYIVTGGAGFIGSNLCEYLVNHGHDVIVLDNFSTGTYENIDHIKDKITIINVDINNLWTHTFREYLKMIKKVDCIVHLAALPRVQLSIDKPLKTHDANVTGTLNILELAHKLGIKKVIYASSSSVYGDQKILPLKEYASPMPLNPYAVQKYIGEVYCEMYTKVYSLNTIALRFFNVYGKNMALNGAYKLVFMNWIESIRKGEKMKIYGDGKQTRDFTHVTDVVKAIVAACDLETYNEPYNFVFNVGGGRETSVLELAEMFGYPYEHIEPRAFEEKRKIADLVKIKSILGWQPLTDIEEGVKQLKKEYEI